MYEILYSKDFINSINSSSDNFMNIPQRTHYAGMLRSEHIGQTVTINGWISSHRDLGGLLFLDIRDREGITQCIVEPSDATMYLYEEGKKLRSEFVVSRSEERRVGKEW